MEVKSESLETTKFHLENFKGIADQTANKHDLAIVKDGFEKLS
jgi:hypothetical protein